MKLSTAIREGAKLGPQLFGYSSDGKGGSCALGAALLAVGEPQPDLYSRALNHFDITLLDVEIPAATRKPYVCCMLTAIRLLNDECRWSREKIADWVETQEKD